MGTTAQAVGLYYPAKPFARVAEIGMVRALGEILMTVVEDVAIAKGELEFSWQTDKAGSAAGDTPGVALATDPASITKRLVIFRVRITASAVGNMNIWQERNVNPASTFTAGPQAPTKLNSRRSNSSTSATALVKVTSNYNLTAGRVVARRLAVPAAQEFLWEGYYVMDAINSRLIAVCEGIGTGIINADFDWYEEVI